ncbi:MAG: 2-oxo acid dehydrogenase subunit E2 [Bacteroidales bacterium]|nr:2-oxo acid dehydrogenase subunit E2 [Bacteroidales bacterium]
MNHFELKMPKMGESVQEATITKWFVKAGDKVVEDTVLLEIATDKVDSEIPSPVDGIVSKLLFNEGDLVPVGETIALISYGENNEEVQQSEKSADKNESESKNNKGQNTQTVNTSIKSTAGRFYSPLVKNIAKKENISITELEHIDGTGTNGRVRKEDVLSYLKNRINKQPVADLVKEPEKKQFAKISPALSESDEIMEMDRMRRLIADHMLMSKQVSPHVTTVVEADVTSLVHWREKTKDDFLKKYGEKITYMPVFIEAVAKALHDFPGINVSVDGYNVIYKKNINIGIAVALPNGNLIVPVIKNADQKNITGLTSELNKLAIAARENKLNPDDIQGGTFTITNFGSFRNIMGTAIINQPQVAILATGSIEKKPSVIETPYGDAIGIRHKMFLSLTYDHRVIDGALGGSFLRRIADYLEGFDGE